jgi:hypothetical protein
VPEITVTMPLSEWERAKREQEEAGAKRGGTHAQSRLVYFLHALLKGEIPRAALEQGGLSDQVWEKLNEVLDALERGK